MVAVILIVFASMIIKRIVTLYSNVYRITRQIRGKLKHLASVILITELIYQLTVGHVERLDGGSPLKRIMV